MNNLKKVQGSCLCGNVILKTSKMNPSLGVCHCGMCRKWSAGPYFAVDCGVNVEIEGEADLGIYNSSNWAERGFCRNCGTTLFYRLKKTQQCMVSSEIFNESDLMFDHQIFIDNKPKYYQFSNNTKNMTSKDFF